MNMRRQLINLDNRNVDFRFGVNAYDELSHILPAVVGKPLRAVLVCLQSQPADRIERIRRACTHCNFDPEIIALDVSKDLSVYQAVCDLMQEFGRVGLSADDCIIGMGDYALTSAVACAATQWRGGTTCVLLPTTLEAMVKCPTYASDFKLESSGDKVISIIPHVQLVVANADLVVEATQQDNALGWLSILIGAMCDGRASWNRFTNSLHSALEGQPTALNDLVSVGVHAYRDALMARNPSARAAIGYGATTACALSNLLGDTLSPDELLAEGIRFESRLATDVSNFDVDAVFDQDDILEMLGIPEPGFEIEVDEFVQAIKDVCFSRQNRFLIPLPKCLGTVRLSMASDELLAEHADAYLYSRKEILAEQNA